MWKSLRKLEFLKNEHGKVGEIRLILFLYSLFLFTKIFQLDGLAELHFNYIWILIVLLIAQMGEKIHKPILEGLKIWKGKV